MSCRKSLILIQADIGAIFFTKFNLKMNILQNCLVNEQLINFSSNQLQLNKKIISYIKIKFMQNKGAAKNKKLYQGILESYCDVCFTHFRKVPSKKINEGLQILVCSKCHCKTHKCCYDLQANQTYVSDRIRQFICNKCNDERAGKKQCFVCYQSDGALILSEQKQFVHVFCALYHNQIDIVSYTPRIRVKKSDFYNQKSTLCDVCKKPNAFQSCAFENCKKNAHPYCVKKVYVEQQLQSEEPKCWNHHITCVASNLFDLSDQLIPFNLLKDQIEQEYKEVQQSAPFKIPNRQKILYKVYNQYLQEAKQQKKSSKKIKRGGYSFISCPQHQYTPYCICQGVGDGGQMIQCQTCLTWYHMDCIKCKPEHSQSKQIFSCMFCKNFYELKKKIIDEVMNGKSQNFELKCQLPPKMSFMDVMWILRSIDSRIAKGNVAKMVKQLTKYPLRTSKLEKLIKLQNKNQLQILCQNFYQEYFFNQQQSKFFKPYPVLGLDSEQKPIKLEENIKRNKELRQFINILRNFCRNQGIVDEFKSIITQLDFKENAISDSYEKIIELSKSQQKYQEVSILKIKAQAYSFLQIVKKVNSGSIITINQLQQSVRKANLIQNVPEYLTQPLTQKYQKVKYFLNNLSLLIQNDPYNLIQIKQNANKLTTDYKIQPPIFYELYLQERSFVNTLYFYNAKQTGSQIQGEISLKDKLQELIQRTGQQSFICTEQLMKNLNSFLQQRLKAGNPKYSFEQLKKIIGNLQKKTIKYTLIQNPNTKNYKKQKLDYLFNKVRQYQIYDPQLDNLIEQYQQITLGFSTIIQRSLQNVTEPQEINRLIQSCNNLLILLQKFPLRIEQQTKNNKLISWNHLTKIRKEQLNQLNILASEAIMEKNPLSLNKILQSIPKENRLVKNYRQCKRQYQELHNQYVGLLALSNQKIDYLRTQGMKKQRREQIQINQKKPDLKRFNQVLQIFNHTKIDLTKEIKQITKIINKSIEFSYSVQKFCKAKDNYQAVNSTEDLSQARKQIEELRKNILLNCQIALNKQLVQLYHSQIHNRIRSNYLAGNFDLDKNNKLLKFAQEQNINNTPTYFKLKEKFDTKNQKSKQINLIKTIQSKLKAQSLKQTDPSYKNLYNFRKTLQIPDVQQQAPKIQYIQEHKQKNKQLKVKINKYMAQGNNFQNKISIQQSKALLFQALKNPYSLSNLNQFYQQIQRCNHFYSVWKKSMNLGRNTLYNDEKLKQFEKLKFKIDQLHLASKQIYKLKQSLKIIQTIQNIQQQILDTVFNTNYLENLVLIEQNLQTIEQSQITGQENQIIILAKRKYIKIWINFLKTINKNNQTVENEWYDTENMGMKIQGQNLSHGMVINYKKIKKLLYDSYYILQSQLKSTVTQRQQIICQLRDNITFLQQLVSQIKFNYLEGKYNHKSNIMNTWIDIDQIIYELRLGITLQEMFFIFKPFQDLNKFKYRNLSGRNNQLLFINKHNTISGKEDIFKRARPEQFNNQIKEDKLGHKKISQQQQVKNQQQSDQEQKRNPNIVTQSSRKKIKEILSKNILKNPQLKKVGAWENQIKMIENQIFGQYHDDIVKYFETSEKFEKLFIKLQQCPQISKKLIKKQFQFKFIKLLVENLTTISQIQTIMVNKLKEQKNAEKLTSSLQASQGQTNKIQQEPSNNVLDMLATGKVKQSFKKDIANEMKKIKQGKDKKKKKSKHTRRSRSRSASLQAKFSSQSQEQNLPSYIQKEYAQQSGAKTPYQTKLNLEVLPPFTKNQPLMFDPEIDEQQMEDIQKRYPRGSTLKIKQTTLQFFLKKKGKMQMKINLYTQEDYKRITSQLVDPGFSTLNIRKQKNDKQILDYLNKPSKKKYKFLICWMEAENIKMNENLKELSEEANQRHKIYGWQNQFIKMHVMSIKQFVQLTRFSANIPNRIVCKQSVQFFEGQRIICVIQYPAQKMYELKQKFNNFSDIQKVDETFEVNIPLPSYDAYQPLQTQNPFYPTMGDVHNPNIVSIKPMAIQDPLIKSSKPIEFQGWGTQNSFESETTTINQMITDPYEQLRIRMGFGNFSPIMTDEQDRIIQKQPQFDLADSLLKSFDQKQKFQIPPIQTQYKIDRPYQNSQYETPNYGLNYNQNQNQYQRPNKYYNNNSSNNMMNSNNPMNMGNNRMNPMMGGHNNLMNYGHQNRNYGHHGGHHNKHHNNNYNQMNRYQNQGNQGQQYGQNHGYQGHRNHQGHHQGHHQGYHQGHQGHYNQNRNYNNPNRFNKNPMFNPMNNHMNNPMSNPMNYQGHQGNQYQQHQMNQAHQINQPHQQKMNNRYNPQHGPQGGYQ